MRIIEPVHNFYTKYERPISSSSLFLGFIFDALTLKRVDTLWENAVILIYLVIIGVFIVLIHLSESGSREGAEGKARFWYVNILQFAFGGIFSAYLILYFHSADIFVTWPFIVLLALIFIGNEFLKKHYVRLSFQIGLYFLAIYFFAIFLIPVILRKIGAPIFLLSGFISLGLISLFIYILFRFIRDKFSGSKRLITVLVLSIFFLVNFLYFTNLIPPIPLSLKDGGIYHSIWKNSAGNYEISYEDYGWRKYFQMYPKFHKAEGEPVYAFSAVFSPKGLDIIILHEWQKYNESKGVWETNGIISLPVVGGRDAGFRTYSRRTNLSPGLWRVNIKTKSDQTIGRLRFNILPAIANPELRSGTK